MKKPLGVGRWRQRRAMGLASDIKATQAATAIILVSALWLLQGKAYDDANFVDHIARFSFAFWSGVMAWHFRASIPVNLSILGTLAILVSLAVHFSLPVLPHLLMLLSGYLALYIGKFHYGFLSDFTGRNDLSYGTYIYGWPIQQIILIRFGQIDPLFNGVIALAILLPMAYLSWRFVEKPALKLKDNFAGKLPFGAKFPRA